MLKNNRENADLKALILCGGKGKRLGSSTSSTPKPLIKVKNRPIVNYIIEHIENSGIRQICVATGFQSQKITEYFSRNHKGLDVQLVDSGDVDIILRMRDAAKFINGDFIMFYGDTLSDVDINKLVEYHHSHPGKVTVTVWPLRSQFGVLEINSDGMVSSYIEKPVLDKWINIGYFYFDYDVLSWLEKVNRFEDFISYLIEKNELYGFRHEGVHITINTQKELEEAEKNIDMFGNNFTRSEL